MPRWTDPRHLISWWHEAPTEWGVYEIGFYRSDFRPLYVGKAEGSNGIRGRLQAHAKGSHNEYIAGYCDEMERNNLYCRWQVVDDASRREALLLVRHGVGPDGGRYEWNKKREYPR